MQLYLTRRNSIIFFIILSLISFYLSQQTYATIQQRSIDSKGQTTPEISDMIGVPPTIIGQDRLLDIGMTIDQVDSLVDELVTYAVNEPDDTAIKKITINATSITTQHNRQSGITTYGFTIYPNKDTKNICSVAVTSESIYTVFIEINCGGNVVYKSSNDI